MKDFFISFNRNDRSWAEWIAWELEEAGYSVVFQDWDFGPGSDFVLQMHRAASECDRTIAVISPDYFAAAFTGSEWSAAFAQDPNGEKRKLVPVRIADFRPEGMFAPRVYIDLVGLSEADARVRILEGVTIGRRKPPNRPRFPGARRAPAFPGHGVSTTDPPPEPGFSAPLREALESQWSVCFREKIPLQTFHKLLTIHRIAPAFVQQVFGDRTGKVIQWLRGQAEKQIQDPHRLPEPPQPLEEDRSTATARALTLAAGAAEIDARFYLLALLDDPESRTIQKLRASVESAQAGGFAELRRLAETASMGHGVPSNVSSLSFSDDP